MEVVWLALAGVVTCKRIRLDYYVVWCITSYCVIYIGFGASFPITLELCRRRNTAAWGGGGVC